MYLKIIDILASGAEVLLLVNASEIIVVTDPVSYVLSAWNCLLGVIIRVQHYCVDSVVVVQLHSGESLVATISQASAESLGLKLGISTYAVFKSNAVILGAITEQ